MIRDLHQKLISGEITSVKLTEDYFDKIEERNGSLNAFLTLFKEDAIQRAQEVDDKIKKGEKIDLLAGIPSAIKDNILIRKQRATAGSKILDNYISPYDATVIEKLREVNSVFIGKTNMDEFAMGSSNESSAYGPVKNPVDEERVPGGSSGGSTAAVAGDIVPWALGSDTGGSIRQPASFCGIVGLKPTYGRVSRHGLIAMASSLDQIGPLTKTVEDAAIVFSRISGEDKMDATTAKSGGKFYEDYLSGNIKGAKIGVSKSFLEGLNDDIQEIFEKAIDKFKELGAEIVSIDLPHIKYSLSTYYLIMPSEVSSNLARFDGIRYGMNIDDHENSKIKSGDLLGKNRDLLENYLDTRKYGLGAEVKKRIMLGTYALSAGYFDAYYQKAQKVRALIKQDFEKVFEKVDFVFSPTAPEVSFKFGEKSDDPLKMYLSDIYTVPSNLAGIPSISFPIGKINEGNKELPLGGQLSAKWFDEEGLLNAAHTFEIN